MRFAACSLSPLLVFLSAGRSLAQQPCAPDWDPGFAPSAAAPYADDAVYCSATYDDGTGPKLYVGGAFQHIGNVSCENVACWDGTKWSALGLAVHDGAHSSSTNAVRAMAVLDDGSGAKLYVGGRFQSPGAPSGQLARVAAWNGSQWSVLPNTGNSETVYALAVHDDGGGARLYSAAYDLSQGRVRRWSGSQWDLIGTFPANPVQPAVATLASFDDGSGRKLFAAGNFPSVNGVTAASIARWDGASWSPLGSGIPTGINAGVHCMSAYDDGSGMRLVVGGYFLQAGGVPVASVAAWNGTSWAAFGPGINGDVRALVRYDDGSGPGLYAAGDCFVGGQPEYGLLRGDGASWTGVGGGVNGGPVASLLVHDDGSGPRLVVGGSFSDTATSYSPRLATWDGASWASLLTAAQPLQGANAWVQSLQSHDDGSGPALFAGGAFTSVGGVAVNHIARWNGAAWSALGSGLDNTCTALATHDDGSGPALYAGGWFTTAGGVPARGFARWDGNAWSPVGPGITSGQYVAAFARFDDGSGAALYAGGNFGSIGGVPMAGVARWNGASWSPLGSGLTGGAVAALAVFDDGSGPALYAGGNFTAAGGLLAKHVARWDGAHWSAVGTEWNVIPDDTLAIGALAAFDDGSGAQLYAGSNSTLLPLLRWNGSAWNGLPGVAFNGFLAINSMRGYDDGSGSALVVAGAFQGANGVATPAIARWSASGWRGLGAGLHGRSDGLPNFPIASCLGTFDDGSGKRLFVGGDFYSTGGLRAGCIGRWNSCLETFAPFCSGDGTQGACPCANSGLAGHGCENSAATGGSLLAASGLTQDDSVVLHASGELPSALTIFLQGRNEVAPVPFGDGLRCVAGSLKRLYVKSASSGACSAPSAGDPSIRTRSAALGDTILEGTSRNYQAYYRDANASFCPAPQGSTFNVSNGLRVRW